MAGYIISINEKKNKGAIENCFSKGIYSTILSKPKGYWGIHHEGTFADYFGMKPGDNIYFFSDRKIYGIGKLIKLKKDCKYWNYQGADFINKTELSSLKNTILYDEGTNEDNRCICCFEPSPLFFKEGIDMDDVLASNPSKFKMLRAFWKLSFIKIDNIENQALIDIFLKRNEENLNTKKNVFEIDKTWHNRINQKVKDFHLMRADNILQDTAEGNKIKHEMAIEAGLVDILSMQENSIFGKWDYISHQVVASPFKPIDYMDKMDIYGYRYVNGYTTISKYLVMEIKKDEADLGVVDQIMKYVDWVNTEYAYGDYSMIEAFVVASNFSEEVIERVRKLCIRNYTKGHRPTVASEWKNIRLIKYSFDNGKLVFSEVSK